MKAPKEFELVDRELTEPDRARCRIQLEACGVCGSDLHFFHSNLLQPGQTPGHEMVGRVDALGPGCSELSEGQRVAIEPLVPCGNCRGCKAGQWNVCRSFAMHGIGLPGGFGQYITVSEASAFPIAQDLEPAVAALSEPVAVAIHGLDRGQLASGQRVLVLGAGTVGLVTLVAARARGASEVWITARHAHQAEVARQLGATRVLREEDASVEALRKLSLESDIDLVVETVGGRADTLRAGVAALRPQGTLAVLGVFDRSPGLDPFALLIKEITLTWSNCYVHPDKQSADFAAATSLVEAERERLGLLITHELPLEQINEAFLLASDKKSGAIKVTIRP